MAPPWPSSSRAAAVGKREARKDGDASSHRRYRKWYDTSVLGDGVARSVRVATAIVAFMMLLCETAAR